MCAPRLTYVMLLFSRPHALNASELGQPQHTGQQVLRKSARLRGRKYLGSYRGVTVPVRMRWSEQRPLVPVLTGVQSVEVARVSAL